MKSALTTTCKGGILFSFILFSYIAMATSIAFDLTELRNRVSKLKVNPRGNLWATGHFMGKKSVDDSFLESSFDNMKSPSEVRAVQPPHGVEDLLIQLQESGQQTLDIGDPA
ncbi:neuromedin Ba [Gouania willdenowi]|uniref:neuromedin Ba n=1 Tax=Gouania willdenowi TaxID=441366 RepID=UPI001055A387|nr:bombesin-like [Gouania willdenowi]